MSRKNIEAINSLSPVQLVHPPERVAQKKIDRDYPLVVGARPAEIPLSFAQQRLWFLDQLEPESATYLVPSVLRLDGQIKAQLLERSLQELIDRHESLRTIFVERAGQPMQFIHP